MRRLMKMIKKRFARDAGEPGDQYRIRLWRGSLGVAVTWERIRELCLGKGFDA